MDISRGLVVPGICPSFSGSLLKETKRPVLALLASHL